MNAFKCLTVFSVLFVSVMQIEGNDRVTCYSCRSTTKSPMPDCEDPFQNPSKVANVTCATKKGIRPQCIRAVGKTKTLSKFVLRDCSYIHLSGPTGKKCGDINLDMVAVKESRGFNGCVTLCNGTLCNSAPDVRLHLTTHLFSVSLVVLLSIMLLVSTSN